MTIIPHPPQYGIDLRAQHNCAPTPRSSGIHLSGIIQHLGVQHKLIQGDGDEEQDSLAWLLSNTSPFAACSNAVLMRFAVGYAWEEWWAKQLTATYSTFIHQPGEFVLDDVFMTLDGLHIEPSGEIVVHSCKATWTSYAKWPIESKYMWLWQVMGELAGVSYRFKQPCTRAVIHPLYICGNWKPPKDPCYKPVELRFTQEEIRTNWDLMLAHKVYAAAERNHVN